VVSFQNNQALGPLDLHIMQLQEHLHLRVARKALEESRARSTGLARQRQHARKTGRMELHHGLQQLACGRPRCRVSLGLELLDQSLNALEPTLELPAHG
jgi:hypothetical protein